MIGCTDSISCSVYPLVQPTSDSPAVNHLGKPDAGNPPVRFDAGAGTRNRFSDTRVPAYSTLLFIHFPDVDTVGHAKGWGSPEQLACIEKTDRQLGALLAALDHAGLRASTFILVTADHGGAGMTRGADDARSRHIPWIVTGPGVRKNFDLTRSASLEIRTEDTCATVCYLLGLPQEPYFDGKPVTAAFELAP
jgi:phosphopentomutase